ncbi:nucleotidyltransferase family protein [Pedobacter hartonius]|uniref:CBS domain-containing protein n=1 Tax=Pedobacter hartonius TaxID=425514 RepID=A0A1H4FRB6_9SPHI|nr:nucleotidyltransferase family protein [Pedobacter hartonius]SEA99923.1 CBS domain-containing protein [Pedobacter hartonius]
MKNYDYQKHLIVTKSPLKMALAKLNELGVDSIIFVVDDNDKLLGSLTDGDVRRGLLAGLHVDNVVDEFVQAYPKFIQRGNYTIKEVIEYRENNYRILPVLDKEGVIVNIINFRFFKSYLPVDAVIMAGGRGERLKPLTDKVPKPLLNVGTKPIIEHNLDRLVSFGVDDFWITVRYLGDKIKSHIGNGNAKGINVKYIDEELPLGTIGALSLIDQFEHDYILVANSDVLTNLDYEQFFLEFINSDADFSVATIPYNVNIPYAILETSNGIIKNFAEKPTYTYFANAGIYLMKKSVCNNIPNGKFYNATDLLDDLIKGDYKVTSYPLRGYWLDIGKHDDYKKAQEDINYIKF